MRILVAYATRAGSTGGIAETIGKGLSAAGHAVEVRPVKEVGTLDGYDAVVLGTGIRAGNVMREFNAFLQKQAGALGGRPLALFVGCLTMKDDTEENRAKVAAYLDGSRMLIPDVTPVAVGLFAGAVRGGKLTVLERIIMRMMKIDDADYRDWDAIAAWSAELAGKLG